MVIITIVIITIVINVIVLFAKLSLTPGGLGLVALRLGPEEIAAQDDLRVV